MAVSTYHARHHRASRREDIGAGTNQWRQRRRSVRRVCAAWPSASGAKLIDDASGASGAGGVRLENQRVLYRKQNICRARLMRCARRHGESVGCAQRKQEAEMLV